NNSINFRGVIQFNSLGNSGTPDGFQTPSSLAGFTTILTVRGSNYLNDDGGYITGDGGIIKVGGGYLGIREHNPEWTGQIIVSEGQLELYSAGDPAGRGTLPIILGHNLFAEQAGETVTGNSTVTLTVRDEGGYRDVSTVAQDIIVRNDDGAGSQTKRIGARYLANIDEVNYDGSLTLRDDVQFFYQDDARDSTSTTGSNTRNDTRSNGTLGNMETVFINFNGDITGAVGNDITTIVSQSGSGNIVNGSITSPFDDLVIRAIFGLNGDNSGWAGDLAIGNTNTGGDVDTQHIVAIGNPLAISSLNNVTLHSNATFRASGNEVVIGSLLDGSSGVERFLENSSAVAPGSITVTQSVDQTVNVVIRDGETVFILQPGESFQSLSFEKAGPALLGLTQANSFTGTTTLSGGTLQLAFGSDQSMLSDTAALILNDGILDLAGTVAHGEIVGSTVVNGTVAIERSAGSSVIHLNTITRNAGTLRLSEDDIATTDNANVNGILGGWATVGGSFATNSGVSDPGGNGGFIRALSTFEQSIERLGGGTGTQVIADGAGDNVNIIEGGAISSPITLGVSGGTTNIYTLRQGAAGGTATIDIGGGNTLRIASGGIILPDGSGSLVFANSGSLTAGTGSSPATLFLQSQDTDPSPLTTQALILGTSIVDNGAGSVDVRTAGPGFTVFTGNNSYSGSTLVGSGILAIGDGGISGNLGSGAVTIEASGTLAFNRSDNALAVAGALTGSGTIIQNGSGTTTLGAAAGSSALNFILAQGVLATGVNSAINTTGNLTFGDSVGSSTVSTLDLTSGSASVGSLVVQTNSSNANQLLIGSGKTLFVNGPVTIGADANASTTVLTAGGGGNLVVQSGGTNFQVGGATGATNENLASIDLSGLASFTADLGAGAFRIGDVNSGTTANGSSLRLASASNVITAGTIQVGDGSGGVSLHTLTLGTGTNTLNADVINIGSAVSRIRSSGEIVFDSLDTTGSLKIRSSDGSGRALINLVNTTGSTGGNMTGELLLAGHSADLLASSVTLSNRTANTGNATSRLTFDEGQLDILTLYIANRGGTGSGNAIATVSLGDSAAPGVPTSNIGMIEMGVNSSTNAGSVVTADLEIAGGLVNVGTGSGVAINMANAVAGRTSTSTIEVSGGILTLTGDVVRSGGGGTEDTSFIVSGGTVDFSGNRLGTSSEVVTLSAQSGTIRNLGELNGGGTFEKTTTGTLILEGSNTYTGATTISEGTLQLGSGGTDGTLHTDSLVSIASGAVFAVHQSDLVVQGVDFNGSPISGDGAFEQRGSGTTVLTAANTFTGGVSVNDGILLVNNTTGSGTGSGAVTVNGDAVLGGNGIISGNTNLGTGTTLSAGDPAVSAGIGTLTFGGDLTLATGSTWLIDLVQNVNGSSDLIDVSSGTLNLSSASLGLNTTGAINFGNVYTIATFNSLAGTFNGLNEGAVISNYQISYGQVTAGAITLTAVPEPGTLGFLGLALGGFAWRRWRRRRAS
ncbi:MAG: autotransporter-associated beta strand repeat-containing protein, partial [Verrucomicrobiae bacterium]|nr:autotransporter-associated beta strand repeat-containing protein [Verrucomicrobiae bacterium]